LVYGHPDELEPYDPASVVSVSVLGKSGTAQPLPGRMQDGRLTISPAADSTVIAVTFDNGIWTEGPDGQEVNKPKGAVPGYVSSTHPRRIAKTLLAWSEAASRPVGEELEIVPLANPFTMKPGDRLPVRVLYRSKPLAGAEVEIQGVPDLFISDAQGKATVPLGRRGFQYLLATHREPLPGNPDTDELSLSANLTFSY
jgi:uncharacterized GH25 family protein